MIKNILIINDYAHVNGGAGKVALSNAIQLSKRGYRVILLCAVGPISQELKEANVDIICTEQYDILNNPNRLNAIFQGLWNVKAYKLIQKLLKELPISETIVHIHAFSKALSTSVIFLLAKYHVVYTIHDYFSFCPNGGLFNYQKLALCKLKPSSISCLFCNCDARSYAQKWFRNVRQSFISYSFKRLSDLTVVTIGKTNRELSYPPLKSIAKSWYHLQNPISLYNGSPVDISNNEYYLFIGRLSPEKGLSLFCQAMKDLNLKGMVLGDGELRQKYEKEFPMVKFAGWVSGVKKEELIQKGKCLVFPSLWYEGNPLIIAEMKSYGIPCIIPDKCAANEEIKDSESGYIFSIGDLDSLENMILKYEKTDLKQMQENLLSSFSREPYAEDTHIDNLIKIYEKVMRG